MIVELVATAFALLPPAAFALPFALERHHSRAERTRHAACLRSIDRLERELFPQWFPKPALDPHNRRTTAENSIWFKQATAAAIMHGLDPDKLSFEPGAVWPVERSHCVQVIPGAYSLSAVPARSQAAVQSLLRDGRFESPAE